MFLIQTTDYFYPLINDPYKMGWIACNNVISDLYAMGVTRIVMALKNKYFFQLFHSSRIVTILSFDILFTTKFSRNAIKVAGLADIIIRELYTIRFIVDYFLILVSSIFVLLDTIGAFLIFPLKSLSVYKKKLIFG